MKLFVSEFFILLKKRILNERHVYKFVDFIAENSVSCKLDANIFGNCRRGRRMSRFFSFKCEWAKMAMLHLAYNLLLGQHENCNKQICIVVYVG